MSDKVKFPRADCLRVIRELKDDLDRCCERWIVAGSLRRRKEQVGDIEILYIPNIVLRADMTLLDPCMGPDIEVNLVDELLSSMLITGVLERRKNVNGGISWGGENKLARHVASGIPIDFFSTTNACWWNYLVCRTGGAETNKTICNAAIARGKKWHPYGEGFSSNDGLTFPARSEKAVFEIVGLPYFEPWERA